MCAYGLLLFRSCHSPTHTDVFVETEEADEVAYTTVINACAAADKADIALRLLDEMTEEKGFVPNAAACFAAAKACKRAGQWERALVLIDDMEAKGVAPVSAILECVADACLAAGRRDHALALLQRMQARGLGPPEGLYARVSMGRATCVPALTQNCLPPHVITPSRTENTHTLVNDRPYPSRWRTGTPVGP